MVVVQLGGGSELDVGHVVDVVGVVDFRHVVAGRIVDG